jgi:hypothetical protein
MPWQEYLSRMSGERSDPSLYGTRWANDARCARDGSQHRRVGSMTQQSARPLFGQFALVVKR